MVQPMVVVRSLFRNQISKVNLFVKRINSFQQTAPSQMSDLVLNTPLIIVKRIEA